MQAVEDSNPETIMIILNTVHVRGKFLIKLNNHAFVKIVFYFFTGKTITKSTSNDNFPSRDSPSIPNWQQYHKTWLN